MSDNDNQPDPSSGGQSGKAAGATPSPSGFGSDGAPGQGSNVGGAGSDPLTTADGDRDSDPGDLGGVGTQRGPGGSSRD